MTSPTQAVNKNNFPVSSRAFSLIELMIVIVIMGLVYSMVNLNFSQTKTNEEILGPKNLADFLRRFKDEPSRQFIIYGDNCEKALLDPVVEDLQLDGLAFSKNIKVYESDTFGVYNEKEFAPIEIDEREQKVCFNFKKHPNGSVTPMILKNRALFYYIDPYFEKAEAFRTLEAAIAASHRSAVNPTYLGLRRQ